MPSLALMLSKLHKFYFPLSANAARSTPSFCLSWIVQQGDEDFLRKHRGCYSVVLKFAKFLFQGVWAWSFWSKTCFIFHLRQFCIHIFCLSSPKVKEWNMRYDNRFEWTLGSSTSHGQSLTTLFPNKFLNVTVQLLLKCKWYQINNKGFIRDFWKRTSTLFVLNWKLTILSVCKYLQFSFQHPVASSHKEIFGNVRDLSTHLFFCSTQELSPSQLFSQEGITFNYTGAFDSIINIMEEPTSEVNFLLQRRHGALLGWDREAKKLWPSLQRNALEEAWGFSLVGGLDYLEAAGRSSGVVTKRGDVGLWLKVAIHCLVVVG